MSDREALQGFTEKWLAQWPEWPVAEVFVPAEHRELARAWFSLRDELTEAAWGGDDPRPGEAKLGWWAEELDGWSRGARRHPLGLALQPLPAPWTNLAECLPALRASRERPRDLDDALFSLEPYAEAVAGVSQRLFDAQTPAPSQISIAVSSPPCRAISIWSSTCRNTPSSTWNNSTRCSTGWLPMRERRSGATQALMREKWVSMDGR